MEAVLLPSDREGVVGRLLTPEIPVPEDTQMCVSFWYIHNGETNRDRLMVFAKILEELGHPLWEEKGKYGICVLTIFVMTVKYSWYHSELKRTTLTNR